MRYLFFLGAIMFLAMHTGLTFLEHGTDSRRNQVNALVKKLWWISRFPTLLSFFGRLRSRFGSRFLDGCSGFARQKWQFVGEFFLSGHICRDNSSH
jgi:ammonia channel protein AmtB